MYADAYSLEFHQAYVVVDDLDVASALGEGDVQPVECSIRVEWMW